MSNRPSIELVLGLHSYERIAVLPAYPDATYPSDWIAIRSRQDLILIDPYKAVVIDRTETSARMLSSIGEQGPRWVALIPADIEQEKSMRRVLSACYPWADVWTFSSSLGKVIAARSASGRAYDRSTVIDERTKGIA